MKLFTYYSLFAFAALFFLFGKIATALANPTRSNATQCQMSDGGVPVQSAIPNKIVCLAPDGRVKWVR